MPLYLATFCCFKVASAMFLWRRDSRQGLARRASKAFSTDTRLPESDHTSVVATFDLA